MSGIAWPSKHDAPAPVGEGSTHSRVSQNIGNVTAGDNTRVFVGINATYGAVPERERILDWLVPAKLRVSQFKENMKLQEARAANTGENFLNGDFRNWLFSKSSLLWLHGDVGSGKTMLCSLLIQKIPTLLEDIKDSYPADTEHALAYFYCSFRNNGTHDVDNFLRAIIAQLCGKRWMFTSLKDLFSKCQPNPPSHSQLLGVIHSILRSITGCTPVFKDQKPIELPQSVTLVLDGLDEVPPGNPRHDFLEILDSMTSLQHQKFRIIVVSREEGDIKSSLRKEGNWIWLRRTTEQVTQDIDQLVDTRISRHRTLKSQPDDVKIMIRKGLSTRSQGMFRLAALQMTELERLTYNLREVQKEDLDQILASLPRDLDKFYDLIIARIHGNLLVELEIALKWLLFAARPMFIEEIVEACAIRFPSQDGPPSIKKHRHALDIVDNLSGLVKLEPPLVDENEPIYSGTHTLEIAHFSVHEYLYPMNDINRPLGLLRFTDIRKEHQNIARSCLAYIHHCHSDVEARTIKFPLRDYCWNSWALHITATERNNTDKARSTPASIRLHNSVATPLLYKSTPGIVSEECAVLEKYATFLEQNSYKNLVNVLQNLEFPFKLSSSLKESIMQQTPYNRRLMGDCPNAMRLAILYPSKDPQAPIKCGLCIDSLDNNPDYIALSYCWGRYIDWLTICVNGLPWQVTENLNSALKSIRRKDQPLVLWVDAICISMHDLEERSRQISLMAQIYGRAKEVIMWLGESMEDSDVAMKYLDGDYQSTAELDGDGRISCSLNSLFDRYLWSRVWVLLEAVVAESLRVYCGQYSSLFDTWPDIQHLKTTPFSSSASDWDAVSALQTLRIQYRKDNKKGFGLADLLYLSRRYQSSYLLDKVYALLNLLSDEERRNPLLQPDYSLSAEEVSLKLTVYVLKRHQNLCALANANFSQRSGYIEEASWVLHLAAITTPLTFGSSKVSPRDSYNAGGRRLLEDHPINFSEDLRILKVWGFAIGQVSFQSSSLYTWQDNIDKPWEQKDEPTASFQCGQYKKAIASHSVEVGDLVVVLFGSIVPFLLQESEESGIYHLVGECYVEGIMNGEAMTAYQNGEYKGQEFWIV